MHKFGQTRSAMIVLSDQGVVSVGVCSISVLAGHSCHLLWHPRVLGGSSIVGARIFLVEAWRAVGRASVLRGEWCQGYPALFVCILLLPGMSVDGLL